MSAKSFKLTTGVPTFSGKDPEQNSEVVSDAASAETSTPSDKQCWLSCYGSDGADQFPYDRGKDDGVEGSGSGDGAVGVPANNYRGIPVSPKKKKKSKKKEGHISPGRAKYLARGGGVIPAALFLQQQELKLLPGRSLAIAGEMC